MLEFQWWLDNIENLLMIDQAETPPDDNKYSLSIEEAGTTPNKYIYRPDDIAKSQCMTNK